MGPGASDESGRRTAPPGLPAASGNFASSRETRLFLLLAGFLINVVTLYAIYVYANRNVRRRFAVVPLGAVDNLERIDTVDWLRLKRPVLADARNADAIVADFSADSPNCRSIISAPMHRC